MLLTQSTAYRFSPAHPTDGLTQSRAPADSKQEAERMLGKIKEKWGWTKECRKRYLLSKPDIDFATFK